MRKLCQYCFNSRSLSKWLVCFSSTVHFSKGCGSCAVCNPHILKTAVQIFSDKEITESVHIHCDFHLLCEHTSAEKVIPCKRVNYTTIGAKIKNSADLRKYTMNKFLIVYNCSIALDPLTVCVQLRGQVIRSLLIACPGFESDCGNKQKHS